MNRVDRSTHDPAAAAPSEPDLPRRIGGEIRDLRKARGVTLAAMAEASGLSVGYLSLVERNLATPSIKSLHAVSRALGATIGWFFETGEAPEAERDLIVRRARRRALCACRRRSWAGDPRPARTLGRRPRGDTGGRRQFRLSKRAAASLLQSRSRRDRGDLGDHAAELLMRRLANCREHGQAHWSDLATLIIYIAPQVNIS
jgi:transcriptional regulator with XRE-family HTH domain